jgi:hypothetical protein
MLMRDVCHIDIVTSEYIITMKPIISIMSNNIISMMINMSIKARTESNTYDASAQTAHLQDFQEQNTKFHTDRDQIWLL